MPSDQGVLSAKESMLTKAFTLHFASTLPKGHTISAERSCLIYMCVDEDLTMGHPELAPRLACSATRATTWPGVCSTKAST